MDDLGDHYVTSDFEHSVHVDNEVQNRPLLQQFITKRKQWFSWHEVGEKQPNAIQSQIMEMLVTDMVYRVFKAESQREIAGRGLAIPLVVALANSAYVNSQVFAIRRLIDPEKGRVLSLTRLLKELKRSKRLITRENYVSHDGTPYDPESWKVSTKIRLSTDYEIYGIDAPSLASYARRLNVTIALIV